MRRMLLLLLAVALTGCNLASQAPTAAPGEPTYTPLPTRTPKPAGRPTATPTQAPPTPTLRPTAAQPTPSLWTQADMPVERVCLILDRRSIEDEYTWALVRMGALIARLEGTPEWMGDPDFGREAKRVADEVDNLPDLPCTLWGKQVLLDGASDLLAAFEWYDEQPTWSAIALTNARSAHTLGSSWWTGSRWWSTIAVPIH